MPDSGDDYFTLLGLERGFELDEKLLDRNYFAAQQKYHPDKISKNNELSAKVNKAYKTLKDRFNRLEYLVRDEKLAADQELLMEMMELRENPKAGIKKAQSQIEDLYKQTAALYAKQEMNKLAANFVRIKYLTKFLNDAAANP
jgi:DnaJ-domain-containing protein 1